MRNIRLVVLILVLGLFLPNQEAIGTTPSIATYFDENGLQIEICDGYRFSDIHVVALNVNAWVSSFRYKIEFPPPFTFLGGFGFVADPIVDGTADTGIEISYPSPVYFGANQLIHTAGVVWTCSYGCPYSNVYIAPVPFPGLTEIEVDVVQGETTTTLFLNTSAAVLCPTLPVQQQTWGKIKALYR